MPISDMCVFWFRILTASTLALMAGVVQCFAVSPMLPVDTQGNVGSGILMFSVLTKRQLFHAVWTKNIVDFAQLKRFSYVTFLYSHS